MNLKDAEESRDLIARLNNLPGQTHHLKINGNTYSSFPKKECYIFFRVKAIPKDMTQYRSSEWSEFSEPYHYIP